MKGFLIGLLGVMATVAQAQLPGNLARYTQPGVDVQNYAFSLTLSDSTNSIQGEATIRFTRADDRQTVWFDLISAKQDSTKTGMTVRSVTLVDGKAAPFSQRNDRVFINLPAAPSQPTDVVIRYDGTPAKGLITARTSLATGHFLAITGPTTPETTCPLSTIHLTRQPARLASTHCLPIASLPTVSLGAKARCRMVES